MVWLALVGCAIFFAVGIAVTMNPRGWAEGTRASQKRYLGFWAPPDDQVDQPDPLGKDRAANRVLSMRILGPVFIIFSVVAGVVFVLHH